MSEKEARSKTPGKKGCWVTMLAVVLLEKRMAAEKALWEMVADKALRFVRGKVAAGEEKTLREAAEAVVG